MVIVIAYDTYTVSTLGANVQCLRSLSSKRLKPSAKPIPDEVVCLLFLRALPDEYSVFRQTLEREREKLTIHQLQTELRVQNDLKKGGKSSSSRASGSACLVSGTRRGNSKQCGNSEEKRMGGLVARLATAKVSCLCSSSPPHSIHISARTMVLNCDSSPEVH